MFKGLNTVYVALVVVLVLGLGVWGYSICPPEAAGACTLPAWPDRLALASRFFLRASGPLPWAHPPWQMLVAQYLAPFVLPFVALLATLRIALANMRRDVRLALARGKRRHFVVCGLGETGTQVVQNLTAAGKDVVVVERDGDSPHAVGLEHAGVPVLRGDAADIAVLRQAGLARASAVVLSTGQDTVNVDIALRIRESLGKQVRRRPLTVLIELRDEWLFGRIIEHDREPLGTPAVELRPFNTYEDAARLLIKTLRPQPVDDGATRPVFLFGFGRMGREVLLHLLRAAPVPLGATTRLLVFDRDAKNLGARFGLATPVAGELAQLEFVDSALDTGAPEAWDVLERRLEADAPLALMVCLPDDGNTLHLALELRSRLDKRGHMDIPVFVRLQQHQRLGAFASEIERIEPYRDRLRVFGALEELLQPGILVGWRLDTLARAYHEHYLKSQPGGPPWEQLPEQFRISNRRAADHVSVKLAQLGLNMVRSESPRLLVFSTGETEVLAQLEHRRWFIERRLLGWTHGEMRDDAQRRNPILLEWERLPEEARARNREATGALPQILARAGFEIRRA